MKTYLPKVKDRQEFISNDIYRYIASNSSLTIKQVKECFEVYKQVLTELLYSKYTNNKIVIPLPSIGKFYICKRKGRKAGSTYKIPIDFNSKEMKTVKIEEDEKNKYLLSFSVGKTFRNEINEFFRKKYG